MAVDTPEVQRGIVKWTLISGVIIAALTYFFGQKQFTYGFGFGIALMIFNYRVVGIIMDKAFKTIAPTKAKVLSFLSYHLRFWIIVVIMYLVIPKAGYQFGVGSFAGILLPKIVMGIFVVISTDDEWWRHAKPADKTPDDSGKKDDGLRYPGLDHDERFNKNKI